MNDSAPDTATPVVPTSAAIGPISLDGWFLQHQLFRVDWPSLKGADPTEAAGFLARFGRLFDAAGEEREGWSGIYRVVGGGADLLILHFRPALEDLIEAAHEIQLSDLGDYLLLEQEYLSIVELGLYALTLEIAGRVDPADREAWAAAVEEGLAAERDKEFVKRRLHPVRPEGMPYVCYYPMDKRRGPGQNWYTLPLEERAALMRDHGTLGRSFAGRIQQVISGSMGLADWEWAVTLWAADPREFKNIISEMRYDEASAEYAEFGPFYVGVHMTSEDLSGLLPQRAE